MREAIDPRVKPAQEVCNSPGPGDIGWEFTVINGETYQQTYDRLADTLDCIDEMLDQADINGTVVVK